MHQREPSFELDVMSWVDVVAYLAHDPRLIIPVGALDQHGAHLPLGTNELIARSIARDLSREFHVLRAPTFYYGVSAETNLAYAGATSLKKKTLHLALNEILTAWEGQGVTELIIITAQRYEPHIEAIATLYPRRARVRVVQVWDTPIADLLEVQHAPLHADEAETSVMLFLYPELVRMDRSHDFEMSPKHFQRYLEGRLDLPGIGAGTIGRPSTASAEKGERIYRRMLDSIRQAIFLRPSDSDSDSL
jgi:creatinine amidohydrolase